MAGLLIPAASGAGDLLRVGTSGDYAPFSIEIPEAAAGGADFQGLAPDIARAYAKDRRLTLLFVPFRWPDLVADLEAGRFDVAMGGVTVRPERSLSGRFTLPITGSGAVALVPAAGPIEGVEGLDRPGLRIAVNAGGHLERTARQHFPRATLLPTPNNADVMTQLEKGKADAVITDTREAPHWRAKRPGLRTLGPFTRDHKAFLVSAQRPELARDLDAWLLANERNGRLAQWRSRHLGDEPGGETPRPVLSGLLAAMAERLALMPGVAEAKRTAGSPVEVPAREARVLDAALARVRESEASLGIPAAERIPEAAVRRLFVAQIEAAKAIQHRVLAEPRPSGGAPPPALETELRPALLRVGDRIARLLVQLPPGIPDDEIRTRSRLEFAGLGLPESRIDDLARGLIAVDSRPGPAGNPGDQ